MVSTTKGRLAARLPASQAPMPQVTRGKNERVGIAVRLSHDDWYRASEFALRQGTSLQKLIVTGLSELMKQQGLPPLSGK